jgi:hypothetical protein
VARRARRPISLTEVDDDLEGGVADFEVVRINTFRRQR